MMSSQNWRGGRLVEEWNGDIATYTRWDEDGTVIEQRPFTDDERDRLADLPADPPPALPTATVDPQAMEAAVASVNAATSVAALRRAVLNLAAAIRTDGGTP